MISRVFNKALLLFVTRFLCHKQPITMHILFFFKSGKNKIDFVLLWSFLLTWSCIVSVKEQFCSFIIIAKVLLKEKTTEGQNGFRFLPLTFLAFMPPCPAVGTPVGLHLPSQASAHLFACGQSRLGRGLWNSLHSSHGAQVSRTRHKSAVLGGEGVRAWLEKSCWCQRQHAT